MIKNKGFSLVELLITATILVVVLTLIGGGLQSSSGAVDSVISQNEALEDLRASGQLMSDALNQAVYIYPPGSTVQFVASGWEKRNSLNNSYIWQVGTDPIIAFLEAPDDPFLDPSLCPTGNETEEEKKFKNIEACLYFVAFYAIKRNVLVENSRYGEYLNDPRNADAWVLYEYRKRLVTGQLDENTIPPSQLTSDDNPLGISGGKSSMIADFITPNTGFSLNSERLSCKRADGTLDSGCNSVIATGNNLNYLESISAGDFNLSATIKLRGNKTVTTPALAFPIAPKNLYSN